MALISLAQYKTLMGITSTDATRDARISAFIPEIEAFIIEHCNTDFLNNDIALSGDLTPTASAGPVYSIVCAAGGFTALGLIADDIIVLEGTLRNDGRYTVVSTTDTTIVVSEVIASEAEIEASVTLMQWPQGMRMVAARMIAFQLEHMGSAGLASESIKSYSYTMKAGGENDSMYPADIMKALGKWRVARVGMGYKREQINDRRGTWEGARIL